MSKDRRAYIRCAAGNNPHTDVLVHRDGDLVRLVGHPEITLTAAAARLLAAEIARIAAEIDGGILPRA